MIDPRPRITEGSFIAPGNVRALTPPRSSIARHYRLAMIRIMLRRLAANFSS